MDEIVTKVIECAAEAYEKKAAVINVETNIREELSNQSLLMIAFISGISDNLDVEIELRDASQLITIGDFANKVKELLG